MIKEKRDSLERFIREQINGPGISGYRFVDIEDESIVNRQIKSMLSIDNYNELIDIVPAAVYSTGILFPDEIKRQDGNHSSMGGLSNNESVSSEDVSEENGSQDSTLPDVEETNGIQIDQMYPKSMGFTCCLNNTIIEEKQIEIKLQARYYTKIQKDKEGKYNDKYGLFCEVERNKISHFIQLYELNDFVIRVIGENTFVLLKKIPSEKISELKARIREIQKHLAEELFDQASLVITFIKLIKANCYLSNLKSTIYYELKNTVVDKTRRDKLYFITQDIELIENISDHLNNLLDINSGGYGLWRSELIERIINISDFHFPKDIRKKSILFSDKNSNETIKVLKSDHTVIGNNLKNVFINPLNNSDDYASLSLNIQFSRDSRKNNGKIFLKVQIVNTSKPFDENEKDDNRYFSTFNELVNQKCFFGVKLSFTNSHLIPYNDFEINENPDGYNEDTATKFIYRQYEDFGIGHGCSVKWDKKTKTIETEYIPICDTPDIDPTPRNKDKRKKAEFESGEYKDPPFISTTKYQEFKWLSIFSDASNEEILQGLNAFINSYSQWIEIKKLDISKEKDAIKSLAQKEIDKCSGDYIRMKGNIEKFLSGTTNIDNLMSFRLMNAAMFMQLWHSVKVKNSEVNGIISDDNFQAFDLKFYKEKANERLPSDNSEPACWRAFQLAFIILNLDGIFRDKKDITWEKRNEWVDLIWFPTGGGKTEAYLGLIALTIINRRKLHGIQGGGTAALIRYTLRLLTLQQFQRATLVIMALELMRRWDLYNLGNEPIYIGLWVGKNSIPNSIADLILEHQKIKNEQENKIPLSYCPWCKSKLRPSLNKDNSDNVFYNSRLHLYCDNNRCSFTEDFFNADTLKGPIPVSLCDDTIYLHPPALLFGTVDKFAQLAHKINGTDKGRDCDSRRIFGRGNWEIGKPKAGYLPPDLIIQDELHLLLGPLGSAVALFESAVDQLCTRNDGTRPKVISSTATTRNTNLQIAALFDRKVDLFPKPGIDCDDSFFAFYKRNYSDENKTSFQYLSKRRYLGILPTGRTQIWMQMRLAAILMTHRAVFELQELKDNNTIDFEAYEKFEKAMDYYHTTISYFNSLKEVGKTQSQVQSYILKEFRRVFARVVRPQKLIHSIYTYGPIREAELTGRLSGEEVKNELKKVEDKFIARKRFAYVEDNEIIKGHTPPEFVVATNMISVGIDVSRFNLIIMNSMPRNIAEYIQASSRIARDSYGLVLTIHHPFRARDMSHYEKFIEFHEKMYSYVEPISITPFTHKAVERYLGLYLAAIIRHLTKFVERSSAADISTMSINQMTNIIDELTKYFIKRKIHFQKFDILIQNLIKEENVENIRRWITEALEEWKEECNKTLSDNKRFVFNNKSNKAVPPQEQLYVDIEEYEGNIHSKKWQVPMSLRVIEPEAAIRIISK